MSGGRQEPGATGGISFPAMMGEGRGYVRVLVETMRGVVSGEAVFDLFRDLPFAFWLESGVPGPYARYSFFGGDPFLVYLWKNGRGGVRLRREVGGDVAGARWPQGVGMGDPLRPVERLLFVEGGLGRQAHGCGDLPWAGGAVGFFSYDLGRHFEPQAAKAADDLRLPDVCLGIYDSGVVIDHAAAEAYAFCVAFPGAEAAAVGRLRLLAAGLRSATRRAGPSAVGRREVAGAATAGGVWSFSRDGYCRAVARVQDRIAAGDVYQVNLSRRLAAPWTGDPLAAYLRLREQAPAPFAAYLRFPGVHVACASPELFLRLQGDRVITRPIKGTRPRGRTPAEDAALQEELRRSAKDNAELLMIVDLERNDLGKVCLPGSVTVPSLRAVESHARVHHLVATVEGRLAPGRSALDLIRAAFPGGSITGAPKRRAMEIIEEVEPVRRGLYTGAIGYLGWNGDMQLNIVIRTLVFRHGRVHLQVGGGIVADSDPEREYEETIHKAAGLLEAAGLR